MSNNAQESSTINSQSQSQQQQQQQQSTPVSNDDLLAQLQTELDTVFF